MSYSAVPSLKNCHEKYFWELNRDLKTEEQAALGYSLLGFWESFSFNLRSWCDITGSRRDKLQAELRERGLAYIRQNNSSELERAVSKQAFAVLQPQISQCYRLLRPLETAKVEFLEGLLSKELDDRVAESTFADIWSKELKELRENSLQAGIYRQLQHLELRLLIDKELKKRYKVENAASKDYHNLYRFIIGSPVAEEAKVPYSLLQAAQDYNIKQSSSIYNIQNEIHNYCNQELSQNRILWDLTQLVKPIEGCLPHLKEIITEKFNELSEKTTLTQREWLMGDGYSLSSSVDLLCDEYKHYANLMDRKDFEQVCGAIFADIKLFACASSARNTLCRVRGVLPKKLHERLAELSLDILQRIFRGFSISLDELKKDTHTSFVLWARTILQDYYIDTGRDLSTNLQGACFSIEGALFHFKRSVYSAILEEQRVSMWGAISANFASNNAMVEIFKVSWQTICEKFFFQDSMVEYMTLTELRQNAKAIFDSLHTLADTVSKIMSNGNLERRLLEERLGYEVDSRLLEVGTVDLVLLDKVITDFCKELDCPQYVDTELLVNQWSGPDKKGLDICISLFKFFANIELDHQGYFKLKTHTSNLDAYFSRLMQENFKSDKYILTAISPRMKKIVIECIKGFFNILHNPQLESRENIKFFDFAKNVSTEEPGPLYECNLRGKLATRLAFLLSYQMSYQIYPLFPLTEAGDTLEIMNSYLSNDENISRNQKNRHSLDPRQHYVEIKEVSELQRRDLILQLIPLIEKMIRKWVDESSEENFERLQEQVRQLGESISLWVDASSENTNAPSTGPGSADVLITKMKSKLNSLYENLSRIATSNERLIADIICMLANVSPKENSNP